MSRTTLLTICNVKFRDQCNVEANVLTPTNYQDHKGAGPDLYSVEPFNYIELQQMYRIEVPERLHTANFKSSLYARWS